MTSSVILNRTLAPPVPLEIALRILILAMISLISLRTISGCFEKMPSKGL